MERLKKDGAGFLKDFQQFALKGNVINLAIGVIVGAAFGKIVSSLVSDVFMPLIGLLTGGIDVSGAFLPLDGKAYPSIAAAAAAGAPTLNYGLFLQNVIDFMLAALSIFIMIRLLGKLNRKKDEAPADPQPACPYCKMEVSAGASRCPYCTSHISETAKML